MGVVAGEESEREAERREKTEGVEVVFRGKR